MGAFAPCAHNPVARISRLMALDGSGADDSDDGALDGIALWRALDMGDFIGAIFMDDMAWANRIHRSDGRDVGLVGCALSPSSAMDGGGADRPHHQSASGVGDSRAIPLLVVDRTPLVGFAMYSGDCAGYSAHHLVDVSQLDTPVAR